MRAVWAMFISSTRSAWVEKPSRELFWERSCTSFFKMAEFSWRMAVSQHHRAHMSGLTSHQHAKLELTCWQRELKASSSSRRVSGTKHFFMAGK